MSEHLDKAKPLLVEIGEILMHDWDPIGVADVPEASDEYDSYVRGVHKLLVTRRTGEVFDYLWWAETEHMGLPGDRQLTLVVARKLSCLVSDE